MENNQIRTVEKSIRLFNFSGLDQFNDYDRLYIGDDSCERLLPEAPNIEKVLSYAIRNDKRISLLTSYCTDKGLKRLILILDIFKESGFKIEVVINDIGVLKILNDQYKGFILVSGVLSTSSYLHPYFTYSNVKRSQIQMSQYSSSRFVLADESFNFFIENNIKRVEFDNISSVVLYANSFLRKGISVSLQYPFTFLTSSRRCLFASRKAISSKFALLGCNMECLDLKLILRNRGLGHKIFVKGNAQYMRQIGDMSVPDICANYGIDRIIKFEE